MAPMSNFSMHAGSATVSSTQVESSRQEVKYAARIKALKLGFDKNKQYAEKIPSLQSQIDAELAKDFEQANADKEKRLHLQKKALERQRDEAVIDF